MNRPVLRLHPRPLMILAAIVLCLVATIAFSQVRSVAPATRAAPATGTFSGTPSASGLTSGAATGLTNGMPSASGLTSGSAGASLPAGSPSASGLTSGTSGTAITGNGVTTNNTVGTTPDTTATTTGGSTRGVIVLPADTPANGAMIEPNNTTVLGAPGFGGASNGVPSVAPGRGQMVQTGSLTPVTIAQMFGQADVDGDGLLSRAEALRLPFVTMSFEDMDTNRDGSVSRSEYEASLR